MMKNDLPKPGSDSRREVTLEELLRLKRAERPPAEFWTRFEQEFRTKQLAAAVEKRRWWDALPRVFTGAARLQIPLGATAILAVTFLTVREYRAPEIQPGLSPVASPAVATATPQNVSYLSIPGADREDEADAMAADAVATVALARTESVAPATATWNAGAAVRPDVAMSELSPSARSIAANLAAAAELEPELARFIEGQDTTLRIGARSEPLAEVTTPRDLRRDRLFAYLGEPAASPNSSAEVNVTRERIARRISEDQLYDQVRRIGGGGDRLTVRF